MGCGASTTAKASGGGMPKSAADHGAGKNRNEPMTNAEVESRIECSESSRTATFGGIKVRYAFLSQRGYYPDDANKANQDSFSITEKFAGADTDAFFGVYDGHGRDGDKCAQFSRDTLPGLVAKYAAKSKNREAKARAAADGSKPADPHTIELTKDQMHQCSLKAHVECNRSMHRSPALDDSLSGTTSISAYIQGRRNRITVSNVGDSRAIIGQRIRRQSNDKKMSRGGSDAGTVDTADSSIHGSLRAVPLSRDQTPYRKDERIRIRKTGARILSLDQIEGLEPVPDEDEDDGDDGGDIVLGEEIDEGGDPPRVWSPHGEYPGTAFTRSFGDAIAEELGVCAEPEMITMELGPDDKIIVLASDGVFEFLTNQSVIDLCCKFNDPLAACRAVVAESYELWLQYELRTDDITMICMFIEGVDTREAMVYQGMSTKSFDKKSIPSIRDLTASVEAGDDTTDKLLPAEGNRPIRHHVSKEKTKAIEQMKQRMIAERDMTDVQNEDFDITTLYTEKSESEKESIAEAIQASVMFQNITDAQRDLIFKVVEPISVSKGDWVIKQGSVGDRFYIVDHGKFEVRIVPEGEEDKDGSGGNVVHVYVGSRETHAHPSFGELALMYSAPRAASIIAQTDGQLWGLHRYAFRKVLAEQTERKGLMKVLRNMGAFKTLDKEEIENITGSMEEATYGRGDVIVEQGAPGDTVYVICHGGHVERIETGDGETKKSELKPNRFFGDEVLGPGENRYAATVTALTTTTCWKIDKLTIKRTLGKVRMKRRASGTVA